MKFSLCTHEIRNVKKHKGGRVGNWEAIGENEI